MANPTLVSTETPYSGWTLAQIVERLLSAFGLTEDSTTGRTVASVEESAQARAFVRRAFTALNGKFPSIWSIREFSGTWVAGDHSVTLPSNCRSVLYVIWDGLPLDPLTRDDELRIKNARSAAGAEQATKLGTAPSAYRTTGFTSAGLLVVRLFDTPAEAKTYEVGYNALSPALTVDATALPTMASFQEWVLEKAKELWASELGDTVQLKLSQGQLARIEQDLIPDTEAMLEVPHRFKWRYPNPAGRYNRGAQG